jgi:hypothetical protein
MRIVLYAIVLAQLLACARADEYDGLMSFYNATGGDDWANNTGWSGRNVCNFYGVTCQNGEI